MAILEILKNKLSDLKKNSPEEMNKINSKLNIIQKAQEALANEQLLKDYDFSMAISFVKPNSFGIIDLETTIHNIQNTLIAKYNFHQSYLTLSPDEKQAINSFNERLGYLKEEYEKRIAIESTIEVDNEVLENLEALVNLLEGKGRRKYYTFEMMEALMEVVDYDNLSFQDIDNFIKELGVSKNINGSIAQEKRNFDEVLSLFKEYFKDKIKVNLLKQYQNEICTRIDLANARNILDFFSRERILEKFNFITILPIAIYGKYDYIRDFYYEKVLPKDDKIKELYFEIAMTGVWINEKSSKRRRNTNIKKNNSEKKVKTLFSTISEVCDDDVWENIRIIKENQDILSDKYDLSNIDYLWIITKPTWLIKKNIELFRAFNFDNVKLTALVQADLEDKIHFVIELGLLNTPRTDLFREIEKSVPKYQEFVLNGQRKRNYHTSILDYFPRNTTEINKSSYTEYIYWFYKMQRSGKEEFYGNFFSSYRAGRRNKTDFYTQEEEEIIKDDDAMDKIIAENFVTNYYDTLIPDYDTYADVLREHANSSNGDIVIPYFDKSILDDERISELEKYVAVNIYNSDGVINKANNDYTYVFGDTIISRYKVLRNLSILKHKYGYLNDDMILTAVVHNSYINEDTFNMIRDGIRKDVVQWTI